MIRAVISDLGNVLLHFDHRLITRRLAAQLPDGAWDEGHEQQFWPLVHAFEHGTIGSDDFLREASAVLKVSPLMTKEQFRDLWADIFWPNTEFIDLLGRLRGKVALVMLSNTNPLHIDFARERFPSLFSMFDATVFSYEEAAAKPDLAMYRAALRRAGTKADETLYFDDIAAYADAAAALGMHAYQYVSFAGARDVLRLYGLVTE
jgi:putative hydrolase of the HAD superfamily